MAQFLVAKLASGDSFDLNQAVGEVDVSTMWEDTSRAFSIVWVFDTSKSAFRREMSDVTLQDFRSVVHRKLRELLQSLSNSEALDGLTSGLLEI